MEVLDYLLKLLEDAAVRAALLSLLGATVVGGIRAFIIKVAVKFLFNEIVEPIVETAYRKGMLVVDKTTGKILVKKLREANESGNTTDWDSTVDRM